MLADCWLVGGLVFFYCKIETKNLMYFWAVDWLHGWRLPSLLSWSLVGWLVLAKRLTEWWLIVDWWVDGVFFNAKLRLKNWRFFLAVDWLHGWWLPSLLSWSVVGWLVLAKRLTECWLTVGWWVAWCFFTAKLRLKIWCFFEQLTDCMAGGSPLCLAGRWSVDWFWQRDWQNVGWLLIGGWIVFLLQYWD